MISYFYFLNLFIHSIDFFFTLVWPIYNNDDIEEYM